MNKIEQMLTWLKNRCIFRYKEKNDAQSIQTIDITLKIIHDLSSCDIDSEILDKIISKYYFDFELNKSTNAEGFEIGFTDKERTILKHNICNIIKDLTQHILFINLNPIRTDKIPDIFNNEKIFDSISDIVQV